jgi:hypothetical protein
MSVMSAPDPERPRGPVQVATALSGEDAGVVAERRRELHGGGKTVLGRRERRPSRAR